MQQPRVEELQAPGLLGIASSPAIPRPTVKLVGCCLHQRINQVASQQKIQTIIIQNLKTYITIIEGQSSVRGAEFIVLGLRHGHSDTCLNRGWPGRINLSLRGGNSRVNVHGTRRGSSPPSTQIIVHGFQSQYTRVLKQGIL